jgi:hypothetical protein
MIHPIYVMAAVTSAVALAVFGGMLWQLSPADRRRRFVFGLLLLGLCMSPLAFFAVRKPLLMKPLESLLAQPAWQAGGRSILRDLIRLSFAPLTEEPAKLTPWLLLLAAGCPLLPTRPMVAPLALSLGLGFALGEIWLVASFVAQANNPKLAALPWHAFGGFLSERLMTCVMHALFALPTIALARRGWKGAAAGLVLGMLLHGIGNAPIVLMHREAFGWKTETWQLLIQLWLVGLTLVGLLMLIGAAMGRTTFWKIWAKGMVCPECGRQYRRPILLGLNFGLRRYERCGACHKWHWVTLKNLAPLKRSGASPPPHSATHPNR